MHFFTNRKLTEKAVLIAKGEIAKFLQVLIAALNEKSPIKKSRRVSLTYSRAWRLKQAQRASKQLIAIRSKACIPRKQTSSSLTCRKKRAKASSNPSTTFINHRTWLLLTLVEISIWALMRILLWCKAHNSSQSHLLRKIWRILRLWLEFEQIQSFTLQRKSYASLLYRAAPFHQSNSQCRRERAWNAFQFVHCTKQATILIRFLL